jgi:hypothetical protein
LDYFLEIEARLGNILYFFYGFAVMADA